MKEHRKSLALVGIMAAIVFAVGGFLSGFLSCCHFCNFDQRQAQWQADIATLEKKRVVESAKSDEDWYSRAIADPRTK